MECKLVFIFWCKENLNIGDTVKLSYADETGSYVIIDSHNHTVVKPEVGINPEIEQRLFNYVARKYNMRLEVGDADSYYWGLQNIEPLEVVATEGNIAIAMVEKPMILDDIYEEEISSVSGLESFVDDLISIIGNTVQDMQGLPGPMGPRGEPGVCTCDTPKAAINSKKEETDMFSDLKFGSKLPEGLFKMSINGLSVRNKQGEYVTYNPAARELQKVENGFFDQMNDLLFIMPATDLEVGDVILHQNIPYYITVAKDNVVKGINFENATEDTLIGKTNVFGLAYYTKVFNALGTNNILGSNIASNPMLAYALMGGKDMDLSKIMMMQAMQGESEVMDFSSNPMMMMALMGNSNNGDMSEFFKMQALAQMNKSKKTKNEKAN